MGLNITFDVYDGFGVFPGLLTVDRVIASMIKAKEQGHCFKRSEY
jgi:hypothetical protein